MTFSKELKKLRVDLEITQKQMAEYLLVSPAYLSAVERGKRKVTERLLENIYTVYGVSLDDLAIIHNGILDISGRPDYQKLTMLNMSKYAELSDFDINELVSFRLGYVHTKSFDPCNNPAHAMPIIIENKLTLSPRYDSDEWISESLFYHDVYSVNKNPLRAAMEVFLMMRDRS